jgi:hypothetical protein
MVSLIDDQVGTIDAQESRGPRGLLGHGGEDFRRRELACDQRRHPPQGRLFLGQYTPSLF